MAVGIGERTKGLLDLAEFVTAEEACRRMGQSLKRQRLAAGITQKELAKRSGVSEATIKRLENLGHASLGHVMHVARSLGLQEALGAAIPEPGPRSIADIITDNRLIEKGAPDARNASPLGKARR